MTGLVSGIKAIVALPTFVENELLLDLGSRIVLKLCLPIRVGCQREICAREIVKVGVILLVTLPDELYLLEILIIDSEDGILGVLGHLGDIVVVIPHSLLLDRAKLFLV